MKITDEQKFSIQLEIYRSFVIVALLGSLLLGALNAVWTLDIRREIVKKNKAIQVMREEINSLQHDFEQVNQESIDQNAILRGESHE